MNVYAYIVPATLFLLLLEILYSTAKGLKIYSFQDTITNLGTGIGNQCINIGVVFFILKFYNWLFQFAPWQVEATWYNLLILLVLQDFVFYWFHRIGHSINVFWAAHMPHHSSEEFNLSVGIRASFTQRLFQFLFFDWVFVLVGFSPDMVYAMAGVHLFIAYWHHTQLIKSMGWFQKIFVSPSHHRVHHGVNSQYLDKNFSEFLIIWDKMFGTYEPEVEEVCYGLTSPPRTWDPIFINIQFWKQLIEDAIAAPKWIDKIIIWFMPLGWRPRGLKPYPPKEELGYTLKEQKKYVSKYFKHLKPYIIVQLVFSILYLYAIINLQFGISPVDRVILSIGIFFMIISWGGLLNAHKWSVYLETFRLFFMGIAIFYVLYRHQFVNLDSWFTIFIALFVGISISFVGIFFKEDKLEGNSFEELHYSV
jgi:alkylglycerol monooxygenase